MVGLWEGPEIPGTVYSGYGLEPKMPQAVDERNVRRCHGGRVDSDRYGGRHDRSQEAVRLGPAKVTGAVTRDVPAIDDKTYAVSAVLGAVYNADSVAHWLASGENGLHARDT